MENIRSKNKTFYKFSNVLQSIFKCVNNKHAHIKYFIKQQMRSSTGVTAVSVSQYNKNVILIV